MPKQRISVTLSLFLKSVQWTKAQNSEISVRNVKSVVISEILKLICSQIMVIFLSVCLIIKVTKQSLCCIKG